MWIYGGYVVFESVAAVRCIRLKLRSLSFAMHWNIVSCALSELLMLDEFHRGIC